MNLPRRADAARVVGIYVLIAAVWMFGSERVAAHFVPNTSSPGAVHYLAGAAGLLLTAATLYLVLCPLFLRWEREVRQRIDYQKENERLRKLYATLSQVNQSIVRSQTREELFQEVCSTMVRTGAFRLAWIGWIDPKTRAVRPVAWHGDAADYLEELDIYADDRPTGCGPIGLSLREDHPCISNDLLNDPRVREWRHTLEKYELRALAALPIRFRNQPTGVLNVYAAETGAFQENEIALLCEATADISFALEKWDEQEKGREAEKALRASLREKKALLKEVHHRVKNNLQLMSSLLHLQEVQLTNEAARSSLRDTQARVRSMALLHETLYRSDNLALIDLRGYAENLIHYLKGSIQGGERVTIDVMGPGIQLDIEQAVPCGLIINELVTNSLKHAFPGESTGSITIHLEPLDHQSFRISVADTGIGIPASVSPAKASTLGLQLVHDLTRELGGTLDLARAAGTNFRLTLPLA